MAQPYVTQSRPIPRQCVHLRNSPCSRSCWRALKPSALRCGRSLSGYVTLYFPSPAIARYLPALPMACQCVIGNIPNLNWDVSCFIVWVDDEDEILRWTGHFFVVCLVPSGLALASDMTAGICVGIELGLGGFIWIPSSSTILRFPSSSSICLSLLSVALILFRLVLLNYGNGSKRRKRISYKLVNWC